tara:strand:- start:3064 stop:3960 length:897 start_codon:yes stop_codon:yes gene_type:complete
MKIFIKEHTFGAGKWVYEGYMSAWENLGFEVEYYDSLDSLSNLNIGEYDIMSIDHDLSSDNIDVLNKARRAYLFAQPTKFPLPWGEHPNFRSTCNIDVIKQTNSMKNIKKWTFAKVNKEYYESWEDINTILLGFDNINYKPVEDSSMKYDICYVGGWANNGFNEKANIMIEHFKEIKKLNLRCGILINKNISLDNEMKLLYNSKIAINIHDAYQRQLGLDTNERTYKALGLTGFLISDKVEMLDDVFPEIPQAPTPKKMAELITQYMDLNLDEIKEKNRQNILENHTYVNRAKQLMEL